MVSQMFVIPTTSQFLKYPPKPSLHVIIDHIRSTFIVTCSRRKGFQHLSYTGNTSEIHLRISERSWDLVGKGTEYCTLIGRYHS
jgi:hypothetical protein